MIGLDNFPISLVAAMLNIKWMNGKKHNEIKEEGNRKRAEATKGMPYAAKGETRKPEKVVDHNEQLPSEKKPKIAVAREARAAEAHNCGDLSPATLYLIVGSMAFAFSTYLANLPARRTVFSVTPCSLAKTSAVFAEWTI